MSNNGKYEITDAMKEGLKDFYGGYASQEETAETIQRLYERTGYVVDTHTGVAACVYSAYVKKTQDRTKTVIASTASPFKFAESVLHAIDQQSAGLSDDEQIDRLAELGNLTIPTAIEEIRNAAVLHDHVCNKDEMVQQIMSFLEVR